MREKKLRIFCAGVAAGLVKRTAAIWDAVHPECLVELSVGGSVDLIRRVQNKEACDLMILADDTNIEQMLLPEYTDSYSIWARNQMVLASVTEEDITGRYWKDILLAKDAVFTHMYPYGDPSGYRAVMTLMLADQVEPGLAERLLNHPGYIGRDVKPGKPDFSQAKYAIIYGSMARARKMSYVTFPDVMNLSDQSCADLYQTARFQIRESLWVSGAPICHGLTIPKKAEQKKEAMLFVEEFMQNDFAAAGFLPV